jgi:superfamily II DNA or RNA helicase
VIYLRVHRQKMEVTSRSARPTHILGLDLSGARRLDCRGYHAATGENLLKIPTESAHFLTPMSWQVEATPDKRHKLRLVVQALFSGPPGRTLIFVQKKRTATWLKKQLRNGGPSDGGPEEQFQPTAAEDIHGDRSQSQRESALDAFRSGKCLVLVPFLILSRARHI